MRFLKGSVGYSTRERGVSFMSATRRNSSGGAQSSRTVSTVLHMAFEGAISSLGASRGIDGSIDRVPDPPPSLWHKLAFLSAKCDTENVELLSIFEVCAMMHEELLVHMRADALHE